MPTGTTEIPPEIVRAYDIRGTVPDQIDEAVARAIGRRFGAWLRDRGADAVVVARDPRGSSPALCAAAVESIRAAGVRVHAAGLAPTPVAAWAAAQLGRGTAAMVVTASHNPPQFNGFKLVGPDAEPLLPDDIRAVARGCAAGSAGGGAVGEIDAVGRWLEMAAARFGGSAAGLRIAVDPGNGATAVTGPAALRAAGASVHAINAVPRPDAPNHVADPQDVDTLRPLARLVRAQRLDLGIAWDGDGDRIGALDHLGRRYEADWLAAVLARPHLARNPGARILLDAKSSASVFEDIAARGGNPVTARTGYSFFRRRMRGEGIQFGGETSGHLMFGPRYAAGEPYPYLDDGAYAALALARFLAAAGAGLAGQMAEIRPRPISPELRLPCPDERKAAIASAIGDFFEPQREVIREDGARIIFPDGWAHARPSNTAPALSLRLEADDEAAYARIAEQLREALAAHPEVEEANQLASPPTVGPQRLA